MAGLSPWQAGERASKQAGPGSGTEFSGDLWDSGRRAQSGVGTVSQIWSTRGSGGGYGGVGGRSGNDIRGLCWGRVVCARRGRW